MNASAVNVPPRDQCPVRSRGDRLHSRLLLVARTVWVLFVGTVAISFLVGIPQDLAIASKVCENGCVFTPTIVNALASVHITFSAFLWATFGLSVLIFLAALAMGCTLFVRRSSEWMVLLVSFYIVVVPLNNILGSFNIGSNGSPWWWVPISTMIATIGIVPLLIFPSGRFVPRWSWIILVYWVIFWIAFNVVNVDFPLGYLIAYGSLIACQVYRYRRVSTPVERQQTKWVLLGFVASLATNQLFWTQFYLPPMMPLANTIYAPISYLLFQVSLLFVPVSFFIAIQRYRLFDIDTIISRALLYGSLTLLLAGIYAGSVFGLQSLVRRATGQESPAAIVASTLLIAALFVPLRRRLQSGIDRRFYREKYDAALVISRFGERLRTEVEFDQLTADLLAVVNQTMHPDHASLWLRPQDSDGREVGLTPPA